MLTFTQFLAEQSGPFTLAQFPIVSTQGKDRERQVKRLNHVFNVANHVILSNGQRMKEVSEETMNTVFSKG